jgi:lipopolysaccharide biosynthesis protein
VLADGRDWEDYDLWCRFFTLGLRGVFVPELLCEYRRHGQSMLNTRTNIDPNQLSAEMAVRYPEIFNREARTFPTDEDLSISILLDYGFDKPSNAPAVAVVIHVTDPDTLDETLSYVRNIRYHVDVFFLTGSLESKAYIEKQLQDSYGQTEARIIASPGLDIAPRLVDCRDVYDNYEYVLLLHSKKSEHSAALRNWRGHVLRNLLGSREVVESIFEMFSEIPELGIIAAQHFEPMRQFLGWGGNFEICEELAGRFGVSLKVNQFLDFPSGSMFWTRSAALRPFFDAKLGMEDFVPDGRPRNLAGTTAHAVERFFCSRGKSGLLMDQDRSTSPVRTAGYDQENSQPRGVAQIRLRTEADSSKRRTEYWAIWAGSRREG